MPLSRSLFTLWVGCIIGSAAILPYLYFIGLVPGLSFLLGLKIVALQSVQNAIVCWIGFLLLKRVDLRPFEQPFSKIAAVSILTGVLLGGVILIGEKLFFTHSLLASHITQTPPAWAGMLASLYGAINEEVLCRVFLLTLVFFLLTKMIRGTLHRSFLLGISTFVSALLFAAGHLPALYHLMPSPSSLEISRVLLLNAFPGLAFGWLYCTRGFLAASLAHLCVDLVIHAIRI